VLPIRDIFCVGSGLDFGAEGAGKGAFVKAFGAALALSLALLGAERALAAELPMPGPAPIPPNSYYPVSPPLNWGGVYIGLNSGYGLGSSNWSNTLGSTGTFAANGGVVGGTLGINYAGFGDWVLLGLEGDFDWSGASGSAACSVLGPGVLGPNAASPRWCVCEFACPHSCILGRVWLIGSSTHSAVSLLRLIVMVIFEQEKLLSSSLAITSYEMDHVSTSFL
jgi:opacity protein-like surface antigen